MKSAFITGINGQDGSYLAEHLLDLGYKVSGIVRRNSVSENQTYRLNAIRSRLSIEYGDVTDLASLISFMKQHKPDKIFHLAAQSHVKVSFIEPIYTTQANAIGTLNVLEAARLLCPEAKIYFAGSSEMFGNNIDSDGFQRETTKMSPVSPYGCSKLFGYDLCRNYRNAYKMFISSGILFNHESPRRGENFVTAKVVKEAVKIALGKEKNLFLGNLDARRDWGAAQDYVRAMNMMLDHSVPDDFVIATGQTRSVMDLCEVVFRKLGLDFMEHVVIDDLYMRPEELNYLQGDSTKARKTFGWVPEITFDKLIDDMIDYWMKKCS